MAIVDGIPRRRNNVVDFVEVVADIAVSSSHLSVGADSYQGLSRVLMRGSRSFCGNVILK